MMKNEEEIETLDFEDSKPSLDDTVEMLDFEADKKVSNEIDEMLDFIDVKQTKNDENEEKALGKLLDTNAGTTSSVQIDADKEKLDEYVPTIKDLNIKNAKTRKIVKKVMLYVIIVMLLGFETFINKTGDVLNDLVVYASDNEPIRILQNGKYGYIDYTGDKVVTPKYTYAENFKSGYAIVKNSSNVPLIINRGGKEAVKSGTYFSLYRAKSDIVASKIYKNGLKYGILDSRLKQKTPFLYDMVSYKGNVYTYVKGNSVGLINLDGKKIFTYKLTDKDDKSIDVSASELTDGGYDCYAVVKVNSTSQIVNLTDGTIVSNPTLNEIVADKNNVFYEKLNSGVKRYMYVLDNKVIFESESYNAVSVPSIKAGVIKAMNVSFSQEYISVKTLQNFKDNLPEQDVFYGDNVFVYYDHNYKKNTKEIKFVQAGQVYETLNADYDIYQEFKNGFSIVKFKDGSYGYIDSYGKLINDASYVEALPFDSYGDAIAKTNDGYGVINKEGKVVIDFKYDEIKTTSSNVKKTTSLNRNNVFYAAKKDGNYTLYNSNGKMVSKTKYNDVSFDNSFPIIKLSSDIKDILYLTENKKEINLTSFNTDYEAHDDYIIVKNEYYNYSGKMIYVDNNKEGDGD